MDLTPSLSSTRQEDSTNINSNINNIDINNTYFNYSNCNGDINPVSDYIKMPIFNKENNVNSNETNYIHSLMFNDNDEYLTEF
jgi:hypothetical protein